MIYYEISYLGTMYHLRISQAQCSTAAAERVLLITHYLLNITYMHTHKKHTIQYYA